jgi:hypothetical protein
MCSFPKLHIQFKFKFKNTLFSLGMFTYTYERQDIIPIALIRLPERRKNEGLIVMSIGVWIIIRCILGD